MKCPLVRLLIAGLALLAANASATMLYVDLNCTNPVPPYADWSTAATNIQDAVDVSTNGDLILVTNGVYAIGGRTVNGYLPTNRVAMTKPVTLQSVNGSAVTVIQGSTNDFNYVRCVYLTNNAVLVGFTLTNGATWQAGDYAHQECGGGVWCESTSAMVSNCVLSGNSAAYAGGGAFSGTLINCSLNGNSARLFYGSSVAYGGGAENSTLISCTLSNNSAAYAGGGAGYATLLNCILILNSADDYGGGAEDCTLTNCTLNGNYSWQGGGAYEGTLNGCILSNNSAYYGGGSYEAALFNCTLSGNKAMKYAGGDYTGHGGGAYGTYHGTLSNCTLTGNSAIDTGGGASGCTLNNCVLSGNTSSSGGGGASGCTLNNCTLSANNASSGGGASACTLNDCVLSDNTAYGYGGGAYYGILNNCVLIGNIVSNYSFIVTYGGGAYGSVLNDCTLNGNSASSYGGGSYIGVLTNCVLFDNKAPTGPNFIGGALSYCCTTPLPTNGFGNITNEPAFVNPAGGDFHLQSNSPCINSGYNAYITTTNDLDGNPRIVGGTVDIGAYEFQLPVSQISYAWLQQYDLPINTNTDSSDADGDGMNNYKEWIAGTDPTNGLSVLAMLLPVPTNSPAGLMVSWESVSDRTYYLQRSANLSAQPAFFTIQNGIAGQAGTTSYMDTNAVGSGPYFYRVGVQ